MDLNNNIVFNSPYRVISKHKGPLDDEHSHRQCLCMEHPKRRTTPLPIQTFELKISPHPKEWSRIPFVVIINSRMKTFQYFSMLINSYIIDGWNFIPTLVYSFSLLRTSKIDCSYRFMRSFIVTQRKRLDDYPFIVQQVFRT